MKPGLKREWELFHFSPACAETIREKDGLRQFEIDTHTAMAVLGKNRGLFVTLFLLMLETGIPELNKPGRGVRSEEVIFGNAAFSQLIKDCMMSN
jgi:hypothetical protein